MISMTNDGNCSPAIPAIAPIVLPIVFIVLLNVGDTSKNAHPNPDCDIPKSDYDPNIAITLSSYTIHARSIYLT